MVDAVGVLRSIVPPSRKREGGRVPLPLRPLPALARSALLLSVATPSQALFGDEEARKAIVDLREQVAQMQKDDNAKIDALTQRIDRIDNLLQAIQRGQLEAGGQFDQMHQDLAKLRGMIEQVTNDVATLQKHSRDLYSDLDARIKKLEPTSVTVEGKNVQIDRDEQSAYEAAMALFKANDFRTAVGGLSSFLNRYPQSPYA